MLLSDETLGLAVAAYEQYGSHRKAAAYLGLATSTLQDHLKKAALRGLMGTETVLPGFEISSTTEQTGKDGELEREWVTQKPERGEIFKLPEGLALNKVTAQVGADGRLIQQWLKAKEGVLDPKVIVEWLKTAFADFKPAARARRAPIVVDTDLCTVIPCNDWHIGMFSWGKETGSNWDLNIAERVIGDAITDTIQRSKASGTAIVLGGGDLLHADNGENKTARSGNVLDVDGRYQKVVDVVTRLMVRTVDAALDQHQHVIVRILKGNHDEHAAVAVAYFLLAWYRNESRVTVDVDPSLFWWFRFGKVMLGSTHGHTVKIKDMSQIMAHRRAEDWGVTRHRFVHGFHLHHKEKLVTELGGCISEVHQAPIPPDAWHYGAGYLSGRSVQAITYHREFGEFGRVNTPIMDAVTPQGDL